ncbi:MAG: DUF853 family protein, partial [Chloroflexi bacterium]|nr:DUF853 family protein [Chloroflexota bacterium]
FTDTPNSFFVGAQLHADQRQPVYINPQDLRTHAVIVGMTGSGKTGLGTILLEEASMDQIPQIIIDPKGDMTNLLMAFPSLDQAHFKPWVNPDDVPQGENLESYAAAEAAAWAQGLAKWSIDAERVQRLRRKIEMTIFTPGSTVGVPIRLLSSLQAPELSWQQHEEMLRQRINRLVTALLQLVGQAGKDIESPEHILLANIFEFNWRRNNDLSLEKLIVQTQNPPFEQLGVLDVNTVISQKKRLALGKQINHLIAAPHYQSWLRGHDLDIGSLLYNDDGTARSSIFYLAHLTDEERQFVITLLLESLLSWVHTLSGSASLRALVYIDEAFGLLPPHPRNPSTKEPLLRLLKQARAYGVGTIIATQNPQDLDYKALSNTGMWFVGKLQTNNDKRRVLEGIVEADDTAISEETLAEQIGVLGQREFVYNNIHDSETPLVFETRHSMAYLRGPLSRDQIGELMATRQETDSNEVRRVPNTLGVGPSEEMSGQAGKVIESRANTEQLDSHDAEDVEPVGFSPIIAGIPAQVEQYYLPLELTPSAAVKAQGTIQSWPQLNQVTEAMLLYRPALLAQATVRFKHRKTNTTDLQWYAFIVPVLPSMAYLEWNEYQSYPFDPKTLHVEPPQEAQYAPVPSIFQKRTTYTELRNSLEDWLYSNLRITTLHNPQLNLYAGLNESRREFLERIQTRARDERNLEIDRTAQKFDRRLISLEKQIQRKTSRLEAEQEEFESRQQERLATAGESLLRLLRGQLYRTFSSISEVARQTSQSEEQTEVLEEDLAFLSQQLQETQDDMEREVAEINQKWEDIMADVQETTITPNKSDISVVFFGLCWVPYWGFPKDEDIITTPATTSSLATSQVKVFGQKIPRMVNSARKEQST